MKKFLRNLVLNVDGPTCTYCNCIKPCSNLEMDHVLPAWYLKQELKGGKILFAGLNDPHNIYRCCSDLNRKKGPFMLDVKFTGNEITGLMARSYLYMNWKYNILFDEDTLKFLNTMTIINPPFKFEYERSRQIREVTGKKNIFVEDYPKTLHRYH